MKKKARQDDGGFSVTFDFFVYKRRHAYIPVSDTSRNIMWKLHKVTGIYKSMFCSVGFSVTGKLSQ